MKAFILKKTVRFMVPAFIAATFGALAIGTRGQVPSAGPCYSVATYPQADKREELAKSLREARPLADKTAQQIVDGRIDDLYTANQVDFLWGNSALSTAEAFRQQVAKLDEKEGKVLEYEFRGQGLTVVGKPRRVDHVYSTAIYAVKTTKWAKGAFLDIRTVFRGPGPVVFHAWVEHFSPESSEYESFGKNMFEVCREW